MASVNDLRVPYHVGLHFISMIQPPPIYGVELSILAVRYCYSPKKWQNETSVNQTSIS
jgi:hypothetical protein